MSGSEPTQQAQKALALYFGDLDAAQNIQADHESLRRYVTQRIQQLLDQNPGRLMSILYRIDVAEPKVKWAFEEAPVDELASVLAELVIQRQLEKIEIRKRYS